MFPTLKEGVPRVSRGVVGGVQSCLDYTALSFHGLLAFTARGKEVSIVALPLEVNIYIAALNLLNHYSIKNQFYQNLVLFDTGHVPAFLLNS